jgi:hypothetical protein
MTDIFTLYETGLTRLLERLGSDHSSYTDALTLQSRLLENMAQAQQYGDTETRRAERAQIVDRLNRLALGALGVSFNEISGASKKGASPRPRPEPAQEVDNRSGGVYFEGKASVHIQGDVVGGDQIKTSHETHFHGPATGPVHTGSGNIHIGSMSVDAHLPLETLLAGLRQTVLAQAPPTVQSKASQRLDLLAEAIIEKEPDLALIESVLGWFQEHVPSLAGGVVAVILHPTMAQTIEAAGEPAVAEFQRRFGRLHEPKRAIDE